MNRRAAITLLGGAAAWPLAARAQQPAKIARLGMFLPSGVGEREQIAAGLQHLRELGWIDGNNLRITYKWNSSMDFEILRANAADLISTVPDVIWVMSNPALAALQRTTRTVPTVFVQVADPVGSGFVESLAKPGANTTGFTNFEDAMGSKWLELLLEIAPGTARALILRHPETAAHRAFYRSIEGAAPALGVVLIASDIRNAVDIERAFVSLPDPLNCGLIPLPHPLTVNNGDMIIGLAARYRLPAVFELLINLKTARMLGLEVTPTLLARADEVIE